MEAPNRFARTPLYERAIKRVNSLAVRRWSSKFVVDGVKQGAKLIDRALIITRCHGHAVGERPLPGARIVKHFRQNFTHCARKRIMPGNGFEFDSPGKSERRTEGHVRAIWRAKDCITVYLERSCSDSGNTNGTKQFCFTMRDITPR